MMVEILTSFRFNFNGIFMDEVSWTIGVVQDSILTCGQNAANLVSPNAAAIAIPFLFPEKEEKTENSCPIVFQVNAFAPIHYLKRKGRKKVQCFLSLLLFEFPPVALCLSVSSRGVDFRAKTDESWNLSAVMMV
ncbi:hypothetical protein MRB53_019557 [Persea americana]|uniref:Uncharacterized protein n=1 Tax=Persea americana TaxID=3435 RepID=A0ACC2KYK7_PERAE|nr:hypothetical protein MRB53_019557 [Persea americana]